MGAAAATPRYSWKKVTSFQTSRSDYGGDTDYFVTFCCAACGVLTDVKDTPFRGPELPTQAAWREQNPQRS